VSARLPARARLSEPAVFQRALRTRSSAKGAWCRVFITDNPIAVAAQPRFGMVVPKKLLRTSVRRNTAKRQLRESFRLCAQELGARAVVVQIIANDKTKNPRDWAKLVRHELDGLWPRLVAGNTAPQR
jgi:ribonuclease P protein component